jgi:hypothetical protein
MKEGDVIAETSVFASGQLQRNQKPEDASLYDKGRRKNQYRLFYEFGKDIKCHKQMNSH